MDAWRIHRRIGMSGGLLTNALLRETGMEITPELVERLQRDNDELAAALRERDLMLDRDLAPESPERTIPAIFTRSPTVSRTKCLRILPEICASTSC